jgi:hypothetical protein
VEQLDIGGPPETLPRDVNWLGAMAERAAAIALLGDAARAEGHYRLLEPMAGRQTIVARAWGSYGAVDYFLGILAGAAGDPTLARRHLTDGIALDEAFGGTLAVERGRARLAEMS